ncbi:hypothetical protein KJ611_04960 [Patescibacteria group bacterium]|nr:hypothetical protein [Patescibacteria group bacterium]
MAGARVEIDEPERGCSVCEGKMGVHKTRDRRGLTLVHGAFRAHQVERVCLAGCRQRGARIHHRPAALARLLLPRSTVGYDVMVAVGMGRYVGGRQRESLRAELSERGVALSTGQISRLGRRFLDYLEALHHDRAPTLRAALGSDGGWPMHLDATGEQGRGTLFVVLAGWRRWVLGAWKLPTERADAMLPRMLEVAKRFGDPNAIMRDLGRAVIQAATDFVAARDLDIAVLGCHLHLLRDVGRDLMRDTHDQLDRCLRRSRVRPKLRALARELGRQLGSRLPSASLALVEWQQQAELSDHRLPEGDVGLAAVRLLAQHVLDFPADGANLGFPFDVPMLALFDRARHAARVADAHWRTPPTDPKVRRALARLRAALRPVEVQVPVEQIARRLRLRKSLFQELREALRLNDIKPDGAPRPARRPRGDTAVELDGVRDAVRRLSVVLVRRRPERGPATDERAAIDLVLDHLERHGPSLWGHAIRLPDGRTRLVARTNNNLEGSFRALKHVERRRSGRKTLTQDLEHLHPGAMLAMNLNDPDYVDILCGSLDRLAAAFAGLDARGRGPARPLAEQVMIATASLPAADKRIVRSDATLRRLNAAARSRAPRA